MLFRSGVIGCFRISVCVCVCCLCDLFVCVCCLCVCVCLCVLFMWCYPDPLFHPRKVHPTRSGCSNAGGLMGGFMPQLVLDSDWNSDWLLYWLLVVFGEFLVRLILTCLGLGSRLTAIF